MVSGASIGDLAGMEELIGMLVKEKNIDKHCFTVLWQYFTKMQESITDTQSQAALIVLGMIATTEPNVITRYGQPLSQFVSFSFQGKSMTYQ